MIIIAIMVGVSRRRGNNTDWAYGLLFVVSDTFTLLSLGYIINFVVASKCTMSVYHYYVALDSTLLACSTLVATFTFVGVRYWSNGLARTLGIIRFIAMLVIFSLLGVFLSYQAFNHSATSMPESILRPDNGRNDSAILLPVACFLDPDLAERDGPYRSTRSFPLSNEQLDRIGRPIKSSHQPQIVIFWVLVGTLLLGIVTHFLEARTRHRESDQRTKKAKAAEFILPYIWFFILCMCLVTDLFCAAHIGSLRSWTKSSGWMIDGAENDLNSIGQLLPLFSLIPIVFSLVDSMKSGRKKSEKGKRAGSSEYEMV